MKSLHLSYRLLTIAHYVPNGKKVADIGSDHALLPSYLILKHISPFVVAGEINEGPFQAAKKQISELQLDGTVAVRKGDGLSILQENEVEVITIAGMGGVLITDILNKGKKKLDITERLILQPNVGAEAVRLWLDLNHWDIIAEDILEEDTKIYEIIVAEPRKGEYDPNYISPIAREDLYRLGPILWKTKPKVLLKKWEYELQKNKYILKQLEKSKNNQEKNIKEKEILREIEWITEVISCLEKDKLSYKSLSN